MYNLFTKSLCNAFKQKAVVMSKDTLPPVDSPQFIHIYHTMKRSNKMIHNTCNSAKNELIERAKDDRQYMVLLFGLVFVGIGGLYNAMDKRFGALTARFDNVNMSMDKMDACLKKTDVRIDKMSNDIVDIKLYAKRVTAMLEAID